MQSQYSFSSQVAAAALEYVGVGRRLLMLDLANETTSGGLHSTRWWFASAEDTTKLKKGKINPQPPREHVLMCSLI